MRHASVVLVALVFATPARAQEAPVASASPTQLPVPQGWLEGTRLVLQGEGCSIEAPDPTWKWFVPRGIPDGTLAVICQGPRPEERLILQVEDGRYPKLTDEYVAAYLKKFEEPLESKGLKVSKITFEPSEIPLAGRSYKFTDELTDAQGTKSYEHGYVTTLERLYMLVGRTSASAPPDYLSRSASSFQHLHTSAPNEVDKKSLRVVFMVMIGAIVVLVVALAIMIMLLRRKCPDQPV